MTALIRNIKRCGNVFGPRGRDYSFTGTVKPSANVLSSEIRDYYKGKTLFLTGCTGLVGSVMTEKILRCLDVEKLILVVRAKSGKDSKERIDALINDPVFSRIGKEVFEKKVVWVHGDITRKNFGLHGDVLGDAKQKIDHIFHVAASVQFNETLRDILPVNLGATHHLLEMAAEIKNLKSFVYVSSAYSNCNHKSVEERIYPNKVKPEFLLSALEHLDGDLLDRISPTLMQDYPNTYTFSKTVTEALVNGYHQKKKFTAVIFRPAAILPSYQEPFPGWINTALASNFIVKNVALGNMRVVRSPKTGITCAVPVDLTANSVLAIGWNSSVARPEADAKIFNFTVTRNNQYTFGQYLKSSMEGLAECPFERTRSYPYFILTNSSVAYCALAFLLEKIPAFAGDVPAMLKGGKLKHSTLQGYFKDLNGLGYFIRRQNWSFDNNNVKALWGELNEVDKKLFNFNVDGVDWDVYFRQAMCGMKKFLMNDDMSGDAVERAKARYKKLKSIYLLKIFVSCALMTGIGVYAVHECVDVTAFSSLF